MDGILIFVGLLIIGILGSCAICIVGVVLVAAVKAVSQEVARQGELHRAQASEPQPSFVYCVDGSKHYHRLAMQSVAGVIRERFKRDVSVDCMSCEEGRETGELEVVVNDDQMSCMKFCVAIQPAEVDAQFVEVRMRDSSLSIVSMAVECEGPTRSSRSS